ncbi:hypothetical protein GGS23DRAFT_443307 [Durotheca rogersii]|uniref:uncharacterized protein n=1 Tax=Durotheca rogersii TaxID=419775 RepID=UPI00222127F6|nr:uncharacterized protein GGS23DRAFT_443307 [Durotheca rogersii]KAI5855532.1 hypothetical protein GGS23DRAFT_443307 [Durotheca rogersii]
MDSKPEASPPSVAMARAQATTAPPPSTPASIPAVIVRCEGEKSKFAPWSATAIKADHPVFSNSVPPVPGRIEIPLVLHRVGTQSVNQASLDNQIATYLNIDSESGFAPPAWQSRVGTVLVARKDGKPLLPHHLEGVWMYCDRILDVFGEGGGPPTRFYTRQAFEKWWKGYCEEQKQFRKGTGGEEDPDDWRAVRSPYEM